MPVYLHRDDLFLYERAVEQGAMFGFKVRRSRRLDVFYDGSPIAFGDYEVRVHHTPGHCPGGVCLQIGRRDGGDGRTCSSATRCSPARSAGPTCPAATTTC